MKSIFSDPAIGPWQPLFTGEDAERYRQAVGDIRVALKDWPAGLVGSNPSFHGLDPGIALLHLYTALDSGLAGDFALADAAANSQFDLLETQICGDRLFGGVAGAGWLGAHFDRVLNRGQENDYGDIDEILLAACHEPDRRTYDLISGWVGLGVYFLERLPHEDARLGLQLIVEHLEHIAEITPDGATWHTSPNLLPLDQRKEAPDGYYNLGVAHGVPGVAAILGEIARQDWGTATTRALLVQVTSWIGRNRLPNGGFASWLVPGTKPRARLAWCYGELGLSVALLSAARATNDKRAEQIALQVALQSTARRDDARVVDAGLCHGAAGNGHIYNRLYQATRDVRFRDAARYWFEKALEFRVPGNGLGGYLSWMRPRPGQVGNWRTDASFLTGATGIALAFIGATSKIPPNWDRILLCNVDPTAEA
jgi:hypothetical protein